MHCVQEVKSVETELKQQHPAALKILQIYLF